MGIYIYFSVDPNRIPRAGWESAFNDALKIGRAGQLCYSGAREYDGRRYACCVPLDVVTWDGEKGLITSGDLLTGRGMESHFIPCSLGVEAPAAGAPTALARYLEEPEKFGMSWPKLKPILYNKTQGERGHIWLLAMASVFCDAFPDACYLDGDITAGQVSRAVHIAEIVLGRRLNAPPAFDAELLLPRAQTLANGDASTTEQLFSEIYKGPRDKSFVRFVREHFTPGKKYDFLERLDLMRWESPEQTILPELWEELASFLRKARSATEAHVGNFRSLSRGRRLDYLTRRASFQFSLPEAVWLDIFDHVMDDAYMEPWVVLFCIQLGMSTFTDETVRALAYNRKLYRYLWDAVFSE